MKPSDIKIPREVAALCPVAQEAWWMRLCILSEGSPIDDNMGEIALKEALEVERQVSGVLFV